MNRRAWQSHEDECDCAGCSTDQEDRHSSPPLIEPGIERAIGIIWATIKLVAMIGIVTLLLRCGK